MARNKRTMRAQELELEIPRNQLPVPVGRAQTPQEMQDAIDREARARQTDEDVRRRARERGATSVPNAAPPDRAARRGGRLTPIFDPFALAEDIGTAIGEEAGAIFGERKYGQTDAERAAAAKAEAELRRRRLEQAVPLPGELEGRAALPEGMTMPAKLDKRGDPIGGMRRMPTMSIPPPAPKRNRMQRALHRIQSVTNNPWAQLGVLGLGVLGSRRRRSSPAVMPSLQEVTPITFPDAEDVLTLTPGMIPFAAMPGASGYGAQPPSTTRLGDCSCKPKRRGPKRRCLERAQVAWRSGRYKGKLAGTRCVRWE